MDDVVTGTRPEVSVVLPVFNERDNLAPLFAEIAGALADLSYEIVAVDDGSTDGSGFELQRLARQEGQVRVISFRANAGQSAAFAAGFDAATGRVVMTMDADGQNDPADGRRLLAVLRTSSQATAVVGYRARRADSWWKRLQSVIANRARDWITGDRVRDTGCSLKVMSRQTLMTLPRFDGMHRFLPTLLKAAGDSVVEVEVTHRPRRFGQSKYGMWRRLGVGLRDALGVRWLLKRRLEYTVKDRGPNGA